MKKLELPTTIRLASKDEVPNDPFIHENIEAGYNANIVEGYILHSNTSHELPFDFFAEINVDNSKLWQLVHSLASTLPVHSCLIFGHVDHEPYITDYEETTKICAIIKI